MEQIGRYRILGEIGRGGMATVYRAFDPNVDREVAIKVLPQQFMHDASFRERFMREAKVVARLEHAAIVPIYDFGEQKGQPYLVMRYLPGGTLADRIHEKGALTLQETSAIITRIATALEEAHGRAIVHRDLKPGNILFDQNDEPFLSDFGIVKIAEASGALTGTGVVGTPTYMSPEQAYGDKDIDGRSDVYSLGIIIYEMLTGKVPYEADTPMGVAMKHILEPVPKILDVKTDLPNEVGLLLDRTLAKDRNNRYTTVTEVADLLSQIAAGATPEIEPVPQEPPRPQPVPTPQTMPMPPASTKIEKPTEAQPNKREQRKARRKERKNNRRGVPVGIVILMAVIGVAAILCVTVIAFGQGVNVAVQNVLGGQNLSGERQNVDIIQSLNGAEKLAVNINTDFVRADIYGEDIDTVSSGSYDTPIEFGELTVNYDVDEEQFGSLTLTQPSIDFQLENLRPGVSPELDLGLNNKLPIFLNIDSGLGNLDIDLSNMQVKELNVTGGAGSVNLNLPEEGELDIRLTASAGELRVRASAQPTSLIINEFVIYTGAGDNIIELPGSGGYNLEMETGIGITTLEIPDDLPVQIELQTSSASNITNSVERLNAFNDTTWRTADFDPDDPRAVFVSIRSGVGDVIFAER